MGSPFLPCKTRNGILVAKAHSLRLWLKDSLFCMDLELKDATTLPKSNSLKLAEGYFMRAALVPAFKDISERLGQVRSKKFARLALLSAESRDKVIKADIEGRKEKLEKLKEKGGCQSKKTNKISNEEIYEASTSVTCIIDKLIGSWLPVNIFWHPFHIRNRIKVTFRELMEHKCFGGIAIPWLSYTEANADIAAG